MHLVCEIYVFLGFGRSNLVKLDMFAAMAPDLMRYLGMDDTIDNIGCIPTGLAARSKFCAIFIEQRRHDPPGCRHFIAIEQFSVAQISRSAVSTICRSAGIRTSQMLHANPRSIEIVSLPFANLT